MWKLEPDERISRWRDFRKSLDQLSLEQALNEVANFWQSCPHSPYYLDPLDTNTWPSPWELIAENYYCDLAKACGMLYTIYFTEHGKELDAEIRVYYDPETRYTYNLAVLSQGKYMLNFIDGSVVNTLSINKNLQLKHSYSSKDLKLQEY